MPKNQYYTEAELKKIFTNLKRKGFTDVMANMLISHTYNRPVNTRTSGFYYPGNPDATLAWSNTTRTVSLTPVDPGEPVYDPKGNLYVPNFRFYVWDREARMQRKEEVETLQLPNEEGLFLIHFGVNQDTRRYELLYIKNPEIDEIALTYIQGVPVAWLYWAYDLQEALYFGDSRHGSEWNPQMHWMLHQTINSQRQSGLALTNVTYDGEGDENGDYQFGISAGELWHDDIFVTTDAVAVGDGLPVWYFDAAGQPRFINATGKKFLNTGTGRVAHQSLTGGLAEAPDMHFVAYHLFATNCTLHPHISVTGQAAHETLGAAVGSIEAEVSTLRQELPHANLMHIGSFVLQTSDGYTNGGKAIIVYTSAAEDVFVTDTDFNTDTGILTLFRSANRPPLEQPLDIGKLVVEAINNYPETITDIVNNIATTIVQNGIASMKESYLVDPVNDTSFTQLSSWFVEAPNELMGDFRAVVVVRDKTTHAIVTLQNTLGFDYTDAANEVEDDSAIITDGSITLVLSVDATTNKLKAVLSGMTANAKRIHFCFERCANNTQPPLTLDHLTGEGTIHEPTLQSEAILEFEHLEGEGTVHEPTIEITECGYSGVLTAGDLSSLAPDVVGFFDGVGGSLTPSPASIPEGTITILIWEEGRILIGSEEATLNTIFEIKINGTTYPIISGYSEEIANPFVIGESYNICINHFTSAESLELTFDDINYAPVQFVDNVNAWNNLFDLPNNGTPFSAVTVDGNIVRLYGGSNIHLIADFDQPSNQSHLVSIVDNVGCIISVGDSVFAVSLGQTSTLTSVILPQVTTIGDSCFSGAATLAVVDFSTLLEIPDYAFNGCHALTNPVFPLVTHIGYYSFQAAGLVNPSFPELLTTALGTGGDNGGDSFSYCVNMINPYFPKLTNIGEYCFHHCESLEVSSFPLVTSVGVGAFHSCESLSDISLPLVSGIPSECFMGCYEMTSLYIPNANSIGATVGDDDVFHNSFTGTYGITGQNITLTVKAALMTNNGGNPDGDIQWLQANNSVTIVQV